jgi:formate dehydrogenase maturation protein FdhE
MALDPHTATLAVLTLGIGWVMAAAGLQKNALERKRRRRTCPSCGRHIEARVCSTCA